ncbi:sirohydrochlorin chelatase [Curtobacterium ammoniigenes]|uniref:sirohydrochlorin chelatase n=1 Tax=Curtobacterium ammoniigenes TaxID=395387 RepID=UPI000831F66E|nr:CbiX/SirB N-terminal domain-containing protein [Curtobacterium ammoniigenes]
MSVTVLAASHGTASPRGQRAVRALVDAVRARSAVDVIACHVDVQMPDVPTALAAVPSGARAVIVPLLLSAGYHVYVDLAASAAAAAAPAVVTAALGPDERLAAVLERRLQGVHWRPDDSVALAAAGSSDARAVKDCLRIGAMLSARIGADVSVGFLSAAEPTFAAAVRTARERGTGRVVALPYLLAPGYFLDLVHGSEADLVAEPLVTPDSTPDDVVAVVLDRIGSAMSGSSED